VTTPVSVITGFLGSGKTTLLRSLLRDPALGRTAVIINEFGEIGIDHDLIEASDENFIELTTGCLCCKVRSDLVMTLRDLAARRADGRLPAFERVLIETSGLADPAAILQALMIDPDLAEVYSLGQVITTTDTLLGLSTLDQHAQSVRQVAVADRIVLTKSDMPGADPDAVSARVSAINPGAEQIVVVQGEILAERVLRRQGTDAHARGAALADWLKTHGGEEDGKSHTTEHFTEHASEYTTERGREHGHAAPLARVGDGSSTDLHARAGSHADLHDPHIGSYCLRREAPIRAVALALFLQALTEHCGAGLLRVKGIVHVAEAPDRPAVIHGVQHVFHPLQWLDRWPSDDRRSRIVFIGEAIPARWIDALLDVLDEEVEDEQQRQRAQAAP